MFWTEGVTDLDTSQALQLSLGYAKGGRVIVERHCEVCHLSLTACGLSTSHEDHVFQAHFARKMCFSELHSIVWSKWFNYFIFIWISSPPVIHPYTLDCAGES